MLGLDAATPSRPAGPHGTGSRYNRKGTREKGLTSGKPKPWLPRPHYHVSCLFRPDPERDTRVKMVTGGLVIIKTPVGRTGMGFAIAMPGGGSPAGREKTQGGGKSARPPPAAGAAGVGQKRMQVEQGLGPSRRANRRQEGKAPGRRQSL